MELDRGNNKKRRNSGRKEKVETSGKRVICIVAMETMGRGMKEWRMRSYLCRRRRGGIRNQNWIFVLPKDIGWTIKKCKFAFSSSPRLPTTKIFLQWKLQKKIVIQQKKTFKGKIKA